MSIASWRNSPGSFLVPRVNPYLSGDFPVILLFGPTAVGKSDLVSRLFDPASPAPLCPVELISADSMQAYRGMDIGTAKPPRSEREAIPHHLIDIHDPAEQFNAGEFARLCDSLIPEILSRGRLPLISGGTAFYLKTWLFGAPSTPPSDPELRARIQRELAERGVLALQAELALTDPESAARIHLSDAYRISRALEIVRMTKRPLADFAASTRPRPGYRVLSLALNRHREELYRRINARVRAMFNSGLEDEVRALIEAGHRPEEPGMQAIGYREFFGLEGSSGEDEEKDDEERNGSKEVETAGQCVACEDRMPRSSVVFPPREALIEAIARNSRRYAKRQLTFFRSLPGVEWFDARDEEGIRKRAGEWLAGGDRRR